MNTKNEEKSLTVVRTPITYYGGKQTMLKHIVPILPEHSVYTEAFAGGAALFFAKEPSEVEVINDLNGELVNFYKTCINEFEFLKQHIASLLHSRNQHAHAWYIYCNPDWFSNVERAWAVFVLSKLGFSGQLSSSFGFSKSVNRQAKKVQYAKEAFNINLKDRLEGVTVENDDALKVIKRYDVPHAFHFIDPPYVGSNMGHYSNMFNETHLKELLELCTTLEGKFMLTMYPNEVIESYASSHGYHIVRVERYISASKADARRMQEEWMVCNYNPDSVIALKQQHQLF